MTAPSPIKYHSAIAAHFAFAWLGKKAAEQAVGVAIGLAERYSTEIFKKSVRKELRDAMLTALRSAAPPVKVEEEPHGLFQQGWHQVRKTGRQFNAKKKDKKWSKGLLKDQQVSADAAAVAKSGMKNPQEDWRIEFSRELREAADKGLNSTDEGTRKAWEALIGSSQAPQDWAETVSVEFALQIRAKTKLEFLVAQLDKDGERARSIAATAAIRRVASALYGISILLLIGAGGIALAIALH